jgi:sugar/nucleoside kinase (ribokinase family)
MSLLVTGSIGIDTVKTPFGVSESCVGGSAVYFSLSASFYAPVRFLGVIGEDCPFNLKDVFAGRDVDLEGLEVRSGSKTFRWEGSYEGAMNEATTDAVELNVLAEAPPVVPQSYKDTKFVFLANTAPGLQIQLMDQIDSPTLVAADTMNLWIETANADLKKLLTKIDMLVLNDGEARQLTGEKNIIKAAEAILAMGPEYVVIKKGEYGSMLCNKAGEMFILPAYPASKVIDPTGAGDSFAGAMMGYMAKAGTADFATLKKAVVYGTVASSFTIGDFSVSGLKNTDVDKMQQRYDELRKVTQF